jgi:hypothetical protein
MCAVGCQLTRIGCSGQSVADRFIRFTAEEQPAVFKNIEAQIWGLKFEAVEF